MAGMEKTPAFYTIARRASRDEVVKFENLIEREEDALRYCIETIKKLGLCMKLIKVERFFNGSKIVFYFTAENRVDFRVLVKDLVQEFRTRVEMRQIGVRHETQMLGGLGCCGRELCCASFMTKFVPVSIKMAKEQNLPLNPSKISGACNRLLCCLTHEFETYKSLKKDMPKIGTIIEFEGERYKVIKVNILKSTVSASSSSDPATVRELLRDEWQKSEIVDLPRKPQESAQKQEPRKQQEPAPKQDPRKQQEANKQQDQAKAHHQAKNKKRKHPKKGKKP
jgi:cell fate regulator YaaT (PSP1 superfamily)